MALAFAVRRIALTAAALTLAVAAPAAASTATAPAPSSAPVTAAAAGPPSRTGSPQSAVDRVADFYGAYIDAVWDGGGRLTEELRAHYLTAGLRHRLMVWERTNHTDGVLRARNAPTAWQVTYAGSGAGHAWTRVRLTWGGPDHPAHTFLNVRSDLATKRISDIA